MKITMVLKRIFINKTYIINSVTKRMGPLFTVFGFIGLLVPYNNYIPDEYSLFKRMIIAMLICSVFWLLCALYYSIKVLKNNAVEVLDVGNGHHVFVKYGNLLSTDIINNKNLYTTSNNHLHRNIAIAVNRCFDTIVDDDLIMHSSLHGQAMDGIIAAGVDVSKLNESIQNNLMLQDVRPDEQLTKANKRKGNLKRYPVGTVAEYNVNDKLTYFFFALSTFDKNLHAHTSNCDHVFSIMKLLEFCNVRSQGNPVIIPIIGSAGANTNKKEYDILRFMVSLIRMNKDLIKFDLYIVVRENGKNTIPIFEL